MELITFRPTGEGATLRETSDTTILRGIVPGAPATGGRLVWEGGPWRTLALVTPVGDWDGVPPPADATPPECKIILDDDRELWPMTGCLYRGLGPFRKITFIDTRNVAFVAFDVRLFVSGDPDALLFCATWL